MLSLNESSVRAGRVNKVLFYQHQPFVWIRKIMPVYCGTNAWLESLRAKSKEREIELS